MRKFIASFILFTLIPQLAFADCNWGTDIQPGPNNTFIYTQACHIKVGQLVQQNKIQTQQITDLNSAIQLKDLAIKMSDDRATMWMNTSAGLEARLQKADSIESTNKWLYFGLGALTVIGSGFMAARLIGH